jgi:hypothetical protein
MWPDEISSLATLDPLLGHAAAASLAALFLIGAIAKLRAPGAFVDAVGGYGLLPAFAVAGVARGLPLVEAAAAALLLPASTRPLGALLAGVLLAVFSAAIAINLARGRDDIDCGCTPGAPTPLGRGLVLRNLALIGLALVAAAPVAVRTAVWLDGVVVGAAVIFCIGFSMLAHTMRSHRFRLLDPRNSR